MKIPLRQYWNLLVDYLRPQWTRSVGLALLLFGSIGLQLINPQIMRRFIDVTQSGGIDETASRELFWPAQGIEESVLASHFHFIYFKAILMVR